MNGEVSEVGNACNLGVLDLVKEKLKLNKDELRKSLLYTLHIEDPHLQGTSGLEFSEMPMHHILQTNTP